MAVPTFREIALSKKGPFKALYNMIKDVAGGTIDIIVGTEDIENNAITSAKIASSAVTTTKINTKAVTTDKINDDAVTTDKINDDAVTTDKISYETVDITISGSNDSGSEGITDSEALLIGCYPITASEGAAIGYVDDIDITAGENPTLTISLSAPPGTDKTVTYRAILLKKNP